MLIVGLTGGIASGKSTVSRLISSHPSKIPLIDLDILARQVVEPGQPTLEALVNQFGVDILLSDGTLNRPQLGRIVFGNPEKTKTLNRITHGAIRRRMAWLLFKYWLYGVKVVVVDTPLLVEAGLWKWCGEMVLVWCSSQDQLSRMFSRDGVSKKLSKQDAQNRLNSQFKLDDKLVYADVILDNSSPLNSHDGALDSSSKQTPTWTHNVTDASDSLKTQVDRLVSKWQDRYSHGFGWIWWLSEWLLPPFGLVVGVWTAYTRRIRVETRKRKATKPETTVKSVL